MDIRKILSTTLILAFIMAFIGCESSTIEPPVDNLDENAALQKLADEDDVISSFEPNYNEEDVMDFFDLGKINTTIYPIRVGQRMHLVSKDMNVVFEGDTAYATLVKSFEGILFIAASYDEFAQGDSVLPDTLLQKPFSTTVTRNIIFVKKANSNNPFNNWRVAAVSLPQGGTPDENIILQKTTIYLPNGNEIVIDSPNDYYFSRGPGFWKQLPTLGKHQDVTVKVELKSLYAEQDFVTLTYGAMRRGDFKRAKRRFEMVSEEFDGTFYNRVYEATWTTHSHKGFKHAILNAMTKQTIYDDVAPVEIDSWGVPYYVN